MLTALLLQLFVAQAPDAGVLTPPVLVHAPPLVYPADAGVAEGDVELRLVVGTQGEVMEVTVVNAPNDAFAEVASTTAKALRFTPATQDGAVIAVVIGFRFHFAPPPPPQLPATLSGKVMTKGTREVVPLAYVSAGDAGVEADAEGRFTLEVPPGEYRVMVTASGHRTRQFKETLNANQRVEVIYRLDRTYSRPYETVVRGQADRAEVARMSLSGPELYEVAGTAGQPLKVMMLLPGVVTPISGLNYPVVRGAVPAATGLYLDGVRVPQLYHLMVGDQVVHPQFIESIDFYPSNAPVRFGRISGGVISANIARSRDDRVHVVATPGLTSSNAFIEVPIKQTGTTITAAGMVNYAQWLLSALGGTGAFGEGIKPELSSWDYQARIEQKVGSGNVRLLAFGSSDLVGARNTNAGQPSVFLTSRFHRLDLRGQVPLGPGVLELGSNVGWETMGLYGEQDGERVGSFLMNRFIWTTRGSYRVELGKNLQLKVGFDTERQDSSAEVTNGIGAGGAVLRQPHVLGVFTGYYAELGYFSDPIDVVAGVRADTWHIKDLTLGTVEPRLDVRVRPMNRLLLRGGFALANQAPMLLISLPVSDIAAMRDGLHRVGQFSVGAQAKLPFDVEVSADFFLNHMFQVRERSLSEFVTGISSLDDRYNGSRWGRAYGLELMVRLPAAGRFFGWLSYTLSRSERVRHFAVYNDDQSQVSEATALVPFAFDQTHSLNVTAGYQLPFGVKVGATFHLNSGRPESGEFSSRTQRLITDPVTGKQLWSLAPLDQVDRLTPFARLDVRASKTITLNEFSIDVFVDVFNVIGRPEVYGFTYGYDDATHAPVKTQQGAPIVLPTVGVKVVY